MPYEASKAFVEHECLRAAARGLDVRIAVSCAILGPYDYKPSRMGRALCDFANRRLRAYHRWRRRDSWRPMTSSPGTC